MVQSRYRYTTTRFLYLIAGAPPLVTQLAMDFQHRVNSGFRPRTLSAYKAKFRLYLAFLVHLDVTPVDSVTAVSLFTEYMAQQGLRAQSLRNYLSVLKHYFAVYNMNLAATGHRSIQLAIKSVAYNAPLSFKVKGVITVNKLVQIIQAIGQMDNATTLKAIILLGFFGFFRLSTLVPPSASAFSKARFPTHGDVIWGAPGAHIIIKCLKSMQTSGQVHVVQLPSLQDRTICPVAALRAVVSSNPKHCDKPLFSSSTSTRTRVMTASKVRVAFRQLISHIGLSPAEFGFHSLRRSGACWAFDHNMELDHIKVHGGWKSDAIWRYLIKTPAAAGTVARTFQDCLN